MRMKEDLLRTHDVAVSLVTEEDPAHRSAREIFESAMAEVTDPYQADNDELEIIKGAMAVERKGHAMYTAAMERVESEQAKQLFRHLADEEQEHYRLLKNTHDYLADPAGWHGFDEQSMLDGG
jgi:rubrerythrin